MKPTQENKNMYILRAFEDSKYLPQKVILGF